MQQFPWRARSIKPAQNKHDSTSRLSNQNIQQKSATLQAANTRRRVHACENIDSELAGAIFIRIQLAHTHVQVERTAAVL